MIKVTSFWSYGTAMGYEMTAVRFPLRARYFSLLCSVQTGPPSLLAIGYRGLILLGVKRPGREADHSPPGSAEVKNDGAVPPLPHISSMAQCLIKRRDSFTF
jgi:hypothetical protein